jgi:hypothetical protein
VGNYPYSTAALDTSGAGRFTSFYQSGASAWTSSTGLATIGTTQYNKVDAGVGQYTLRPISNNNWGVFWVYLDPTGDMYLLYGQGDYAKLSDAQAAGEPSYRPPELTNWARLIGKITFAYNNTVFDYVESVFKTVFSQAAATVHNQLAGLQGGTTNEYYHLIQDKYNHVNQYWLPFQRKLTFNQIIDSYQSVVIQGPLNFNGHSVTIGVGSVLRILP